MLGSQDRATNDVDEQTARAFATRQFRLAVLAAPSLLTFAVCVVVLDTRLTLVSVIATFFAYVLVSVARRQRRNAGRRRVIVTNAGVTVDGIEYGRAVGAIARTGYVRVLFRQGPLFRLWLDNRRA